MRHSPSFLLLSIVLVLCSIAHQAQQGQTGLTVSLTDQFASIIPGAELTLTSAEDQKLRRQSNDDGIAEFKTLKPGKYVLIVKLAGFSDYRSEIVLTSGEVKKLKVILEPAIIESVVSVDEKTGTDMSDYGTTRELSERQIEALPDDPKILEQVLRTIAGESPTGEPPPISVNGMMGAPTPAKENIKMVRVNRNIMSAQYEGNQGGGIEIYSNSNLKKISGSFGYGFSDSRFAATDPFLGRRAPSQNQSFNYNFSGPLRLGMSLWANGWHGFNNGSSVINATVLDNNLNVVELKQTLKSRAQYFGNYMGFDWDVNKSHKLSIVYNLNGSRNDASGVGGLSLAERADKWSNKYYYLGVSDTNIVDPNLVITTRFSLVGWSDQTRGDLINPAVNVLEAFNGGGSQNHRTSSGQRYEFYSDTNKKIGRWTVGFGVLFRGTRLSDESRSNFGGSYTFTGRTAPVLDVNFNPVRDQNGDIVTSQITSIESYRRTLLLSRLGFSSAMIRTLGGGPDQFTIAGGQPKLRLGQFDYAFYQQNSYSLTETLGLSFGVRYENQTNVDSKFNLAPRLGFVWAPKEKEKQAPITVLPRVTIGYGLFFSRFAAQTVLNSLLANDERRQLYFITDSDVLNLFPLVPSIAALDALATPKSLRLIAPGIQTPRQNLFQVSISKKLWYGFSVNSSFFYGEGYRQALTRNLNAPLSPSAGNLIYPFGGPRSIFETQSVGRYRSKRITTSLGFPQWKPWKKEAYFSLNYAYSTLENNTVTGSSSPFDPYDFTGEWGIAPSSGVHTLQGFVSLSLPRGFSFSTNYQIRSGYRFNITTGRDTNKDGFYSERPAYAADPNKVGVIRTPYGLLDPNPGPGDRLIPRNLGHGPMSRTVDAYLNKSFGFNPDKANKNAPRQRLIVSAYINNLFNFNNKGTPIGNMSSPNFLKVITGGSFWGPNSGTSPRSIGFNTRFTF